MPASEEQSDAYEAARAAAKDWLTASWNPALTVRDWWARLADSGWGFPTWPEAWFGKGLTANAAAGVRSAYAESGVLPPPTGLGQLLGGPMLLLHATDEQKARFLPLLARGEESWCQFFSEPGAGSDLAGAQTRAVQDGDEWVVDGQKVWTSGAQWADRGMLLARTNREVPKHHGLSFFIIDVDQPGIEVRPLHQMNGAHGFNEVFFTGARVSDDRRVGEVGGGWSVAVTVLMYERFMSAVSSVAPGRKGGQLDELAGVAAEHATRARSLGRTGVSKLVMDAAIELGLTSDPVYRQRLAALWALETTNGYLARGGQSARDGKRPSAQGSLAKLAGHSSAGPAATPACQFSAPKDCSTRQTPPAVARSSTGRYPALAPPSRGARTRFSEASSASGFSDCPRSPVPTGTFPSPTSPSGLSGQPTEAGSPGTQQTPGGSPWNSTLAPRLRSSARSCGTG